MKAKLVRTYKLASEDGKGKEVKVYRLLTAGERSDWYVDYYILQEREEDELGQERWKTVSHYKVSEMDSVTKLMFQLIAMTGVTSEVPMPKLVKDDGRSW